MVDRMYRRDDGFSVTEVVVAAAILFFVLTAVVGLMGVSSRMTVDAKEKSILTNVVASYIDEVRATPWDQVQTPTAPIQRVVNGVTVTITMNVETKATLGDEYIKYLRIGAVAMLNGQTQRYETRVTLRNPKFNRTLSNDPDAPIIEFDDAVAPLDDEVLFISERLKGGAIILKTKAYSPSDKVKEVRYEVAGRTLTPQLGGSPAIFSPNPMVVTLWADPTWDTRQDGVIDGFQTVTAIVTDDKGRTTSAARRFIIDNIAPLAPPGAPTMTALTSAKVRMQWPAARDGGPDTLPNYASRYQYQIRRELTSGSPSSWTLVASDTVGAGATYADAVTNAGPLALDVTMDSAASSFYLRALPPFSRVWCSVRSGSPHNEPSSATARDCASLVVTRPEILCESGTSIYKSTCQTKITGTGSKAKIDYIVTLWVPKPQFPADMSAATYEVQYLNSASPSSGWVALGATQDAPGYAPKIDQTDSKATKITFDKQFAGSSGSALYFRVLIGGVKATGYGATGAVEPTLATNAAGLSSTSNQTAASALQSDPWTY